MSEDYIEYWGLKQHPFLLAPDSGMMHKAGQYYECLERLKYAINTNKGGALLVSEDAGLGKTTVLLKLIEEMRALHDSAFKYAFVNHPTLTPNQLIAYIAGCFADATPNDKGLPSSLDLDFLQNKRQVVLDSGAGDDKLSNLMRLKESLVETKRQGGKNIIIVDEGQMLCGARDVLQELRVLINLTYDNEYLHTFIFSGQKPLWNEVKAIPELWQRLPVRYYLVPLRLEETRDLVRHRLMKAGLDPEREIFTGEAFEIIQRYSMGSPRTIIAVADLALLIGYTDRSAKIGFKELAKAINAMAGKGESLAYVKEEKPAKDPEETPIVVRDDRQEGVDEQTLSSMRVKPKPEIKKTTSAILSEIKEGSRIGTTKRQSVPRLIVLVTLLVIVALAALGYYLISGRTKIATTVPAKEVVALSTNADIKKPDQVPDIKANNEQVGRTEGAKQPEAVRPNIPEKPVPEEQPRKAVPVRKEERVPNQYGERIEKQVVVISTTGANIRSEPDIRSQRIGMFMKGEQFKVMGEKKDADGQTWYKFYIHGNRVAWVSEKTVEVK